MSEVKVEALLAAIQDGRPWLARFTGKEYDKAYQEYRALKRRRFLRKPSTATRG